MEDVDVQKYIDLVTEVTGVSLGSFLLAAIITLVIVGALRMTIRKVLEKKKALEELDLWKVILTFIAFGTGIGVSFLFAVAGYFTTPNAAATSIVGLCVGVLAVAGWQLVKYIPFIKILLAGGGQMETQEKKPVLKEGDKPAEDKPEDKPDEEKPADEESTDEITVDEVEKVEDKKEE